MKLASPNHNPMNAILFELIVELVPPLIPLTVKPKIIIKQDATGVSYPIVRLPRESVGLKLIKNDVVKAR